jgi:hypothetical protein
MCDVGQGGDTVLGAVSGWVERRLRVRNGALGNSNPTQLLGPPNVISGVRGPNEGDRNGNFAGFDRG